MLRDRKLYELENTGMLQLLVFFKENGRTKITDIRFVGSKSTLYRSINLLCQLDLVMEEREKPFTRYLNLTPKGEAVAKRVLEIEEIIG